MKVAILAGGMGSRIDPDGLGLPKALVPLAGKPILWHVMASYACQGFRDFIVALGHKRSDIEAWFRGHAMEEEGSEGDWRLTLPETPGGPWSIRLFDTGPETANGGRIKRLGPLLGKETFMLTWCDGLSDVDLGALLAFHRGHGHLATVTAVNPPSSFGHMALDGDRVKAFVEKPEAERRWISGGFFVVEPAALDWIEGDDTQWEATPLESLAREGELMAFRHEGFWQCMDTVMQKLYLEDLLQSGQAPWKSWA